MTFSTAWCGPVDSSLWISHTLNPCVFDTVSSGVLLLLTVVLSVCQNAASKSWHSQQGSSAAEKQGLQGRETGVSQALLHAQSVNSSTCTYCRMRPMADC